MTLTEHKRWCIRNVPITNAELTVFWFLYGFHPFKDSYYFQMRKHIRNNEGGI